MVDNEENLVNLLRGYLEREGFEVIEALDGPSALEVARAHAPEIVVLDWMLPGLDGMEVLEKKAGIILIHKPEELAQTAAPGSHRQVVAPLPPPALRNERCGPGA